MVRRHKVSKLFGNCVPRTDRSKRVTHVVSIWTQQSVVDESIDAQLTPRFASFDAYYRADYSKLVGFGFVLTSSRQHAEDLVQDALTEAHRNWQKINGYDDPGAWVRRVMVNKSRSRFRKLTLSLIHI